MSSLSVLTLFLHFAHRKHSMCQSLEANWMTPSSTLSSSMRRPHPPQYASGSSSSPSCACPASTSLDGTAARSRSDMAARSSSSAGIWAGLWAARRADKVVSLSEVWLTKGRNVAGRQRTLAGSVPWVPIDSRQPPLMVCDGGFQAVEVPSNLSRENVRVQSS